MAAAVSSPRVNVSAARPSEEAIDPVLRERFRAMNRRDAVLYARARELWEDRRTRAVRPLPVVTCRAETEPRHRRMEHGTREIVVTGVAVAGEVTGSHGAVAQ